MSAADNHIPLAGASLLASLWRKTAVGFAVASAAGGGGMVGIGAYMLWDGESWLWSALFLASGGLTINYALGAFATGEDRISRLFSRGPYRTATDRTRAVLRIAATFAAFVLLLVVSSLDEPFSWEDLFYTLVMALGFTTLPFWTSADIGKLLASRYASAQTESDLYQTRAQDRVTSEVVALLRARGKRMSRLSFVTLALIAGVLLFGFQLFTTAEQAASESANLPDLRRQLAARVGDLAKAHALLALEKKDGQRAAELVGQIAMLDATIEGINTEISSLARPEPRGNDPWRYALSLISTKLGAVVILVFGIQILVGLYRYTAKLATFCDTRADFLQMLPVDAMDSAEILKTALIPVDVDFDKQPSPVPTSRLIKAVSEVVNLSTRRTGA